MKNTQQQPQSTYRSYQPFDDYLYVLSEDSKNEEEVAEKPKVDLEAQALLVRKEKFIKEISEAIKEARAPSPDIDSEDSPHRRQKRIQLKPKGSLSSYNRNNRAQYQYKAFLTNKSKK